MRRPQLAIRLQCADTSASDGRGIGGQINQMESMDQSSSPPVSRSDRAGLIPIRRRPTGELAPSHTISRVAGRPHPDSEWCAFISRSTRCIIRGRRSDGNRETRPLRSARRLRRLLPHADVHNPRRNDWPLDNRGCRNSMCIPLPIYAAFSIDPPQLDPVMRTSTGTGQNSGCPQIQAEPSLRTTSV